MRQTDDRDLQASIIFPNKHNVAKCRYMAIIFMMGFLIPLFYYLQIPLRHAIFRIIIGIATVYISSYGVGFFMLLVSRKLLNRLQLALEEQKESVRIVSVAPLNRLQKFQYRLLGASSRFAYDNQGKKFRVMYTKRLHEKFEGKLYCLFNLGFSSCYTVIEANTDTQMK